MLVFGPGKYKDRLAEYLGALFYVHFAFAALSSLALLLVSLGLAIFGSRDLSGVMLALALTGPFSLLLWLVRRACYMRFQPHLSVVGGVWYMLLMLTGAYILYRYEWLSATSALVLMGISSLLVSLWLTVSLGAKRMPLRGDDLVHDSFKDHWGYGRWSLANQGLNWIPLNMPYLILPIFYGLEAGASFRVLMNLIMPVLQGVWALSTLLLPILVQARAEGPAEFNSRVHAALVPLVLGSVLYWILVGLLHYPLMSWLYNDQYTEHASLLWIFGLAPVFVVVKLVFGNALRALERPDRLFSAYLLAAVVAVTLGTGFVYLWGIAGAGLVLLVAQVITAALAIILYYQLQSSPEMSQVWDHSADQETT